MEIKDTIDAMGKAHAEFVKANDQRLKEIEKQGNADAVLKDKVEKISADLNSLEAMKTQLEQLHLTVNRLQLPGGNGRAQDEQRAAYDVDALKLFMRGGRAAGDIKPEVQASLSTLSDPDGGFTLPKTTEAAIDRVARTMSAMRRISSLMTISTDQYEKLVGQGGGGHGWTAEKGSRTETATPTLKEIVLTTKEVYAMPAATQKVLDDSSVDLEGWLAEEIAGDFTEDEGDAFINGNGVEKPYGFAAYMKVADASYAWGKIGYLTSGHATLLDDPDALVDLQDALKPKYQQGAVWLMRTATKTVIRKLKDGDGNYIWRPGLQEGEPNLLLGKPVEVDDNMPAIGQNTYPVAYGNFKRGYLIVDRVGIRTLRDPYTQKPYVLFYSTKRVGGGVVMYEAIKLLKIAA